MITKKLNPQLKRLLKLLDNQEFQDSHTLGNKLGVTRYVILQFIAQLEQYGIVVESVKGKSYRLIEPIILLDALEIRKRIKKKSSIQSSIKIDIFSEISSTNDYLATQITSHRSDPENRITHVCLAEMQHHGRGRLNRRWHSPFGLNLYFSCLYKFKKNGEELEWSGLSLIVSLAIVKTLEGLGMINHIKIKWPNDILFQNKKLAGTLIEIFTPTNGHAKAIIGIGLNVNMTDPLLNTINQSCTSIKQICKKSIDRNTIIALLLIHLDQFLLEFANSTLSTHPIWLQQWQKYDYLLNKKIVITHQNHTIQGISLGINHKGFLLLQHVDGSIKTYSSGDTSITSITRA